MTMGGGKHPSQPPSVFFLYCKGKCETKIRGQKRFPIVISRCPNETLTKYCS